MPNEVVAIAAGNGFSAALVRGSIITWGNFNYDAPAAIAANVTRIAAGEGCCCHGGKKEATCLNDCLVNTMLISLNTA
jgi:hypothetical protein